MNEPTWSEDNWHGSYYELAIEVSAGADDAHLLRAWRELLNDSNVGDVWRDFDGNLFDPNRVDAPFSVTSQLCLSDQVLGCVVHVIREPEGSDWVALCVPTGMLELLFDVQYPLIFAENPWLERVDALFLNVADNIYSAVSFELGMIGEECSGRISATEIGSAAPSDEGLLLPPSLYKRLADPPEAHRRGSGLIWIPRKK